MTRLAESSLKSGGFVPNVYIRRIVLDNAGALTSRTDNTVDRSAPVVESRRSDGTLDYAASRQRRPSSGGGGSMSATLHLQMKGIVGQNEQRATWLTDVDSRARTMVYVLQSLNPTLTAELISGNFFDQSPMRVPQHYNKFIDYDIIKFSLARSANNSDVVTSDTNSATGNSIKSLNKEIKFSIPDSSPRHLTYFVMTELQTDRSRSRSINTHSMIVVEKVIQSEQLVTNSQVYRASENLLWAGPVHFHPQHGWMEGALHSSHNHNLLRQISLNNFKAQDARVFSDIQKYQLNVGQPTQQRGKISELYPSRNKDGSASLVFTFDHLNYLINNSKFGKLYMNSSPSLRDKLLRQSKILELSMARERVVPRKGLNELQSSAIDASPFVVEAPPEVFALSADENGFLRYRKRYAIGGEAYNKFTDLDGITPAPTDQKLYGAIREINVDRVGKLRTFAALDGAISGITDGHYRYSLNIEIEDGAFSFLKGQLAIFQQTVKVLKSYLSLAQKSGNHVRSTGEFTSRFADQHRVTSQTIPVWLGSILAFVEMLDFLTEATSEERTTIARKLYSLINPAFGTIGNLRSFITSMEAVESKFQKIITVSKASHTKDKSSARQSSLQVRLKMQTKFSDIFDSNVAKGTGFDYFGPQADLGNEALLVTREKYMARIDNELARYSDNTYDTLGLRSNFSFLTKPQASALVSDSTRYSFMAPKTFRLNNVVVDLQAQNKQELDYSSVTAAIAKTMYDPTNREAGVVSDRRTLGLLGSTGKGPTTERVENLSNVYAGVAEDNGVSVIDVLGGSILRPTLPPGQSLGATSSEEFLGTGNAFTTNTEALQPTTVELRAPQVSNALSVLQDLFKFKIDADTHTNTIQTTSLNEISFDLSRADNFINKRMQAPGRDSDSVAAILEKLPTQIKLLARNTGRVYEDSSALLSSATDAQTDAFIYNFSMIRAVEYLSYVDGRPSWARLDLGSLRSSKRGLICRAKRYADPNTNIGAYQSVNRVPVFGEVFIITAGDISPSSAVADNTSPALWPNGAVTSGLPRAQFTSGPQAETAFQLINLETQRATIQGGVEYLSSEIPGAPTGLRGRISGVRSASGASSAASPPRSASSPGPGAQGY